MVEKKEKEKKHPHILRNLAILAVVIPIAWMGLLAKAWIDNEQLILSDPPKYFPYKAILTLSVPDKYKDATNVSLEWSRDAKLLHYAPLNSSTFTVTIYLRDKEYEFTFWIAYYQSLGSGSLVKLGDSETIEILVKGIPNV
jgi:hypothetical protein